MRESVIRRTTIRSARIGAVNLSQGFPDDDTSEEMKRFATEAIAGRCHQYTDPWGAPTLRRAIAGKLARFNGMEVDPDRQIVVTCGATEGMIIAMEALVDLRTLEVREPDFSFTRDDLDRLWTPNAQAILLCNPCNPTGKVFTRDELQAVVDFAIARDLLIFCDETYEYLVWEGHRHISIATLPGAAERTVTVTSTGKTYSVTGWRVGYVVAEETLTNELRKMHDFHTVTAPHPLQLAVARAMDELPDSFYERQRSSFAERKRVLTEAVRQTGMTYYEPGGGYFLWCEYSSLSDDDDQVFVERMIEEKKVAGVAGSVFYPQAAQNPKRLRFTFSKSRETIEEAARRLLG
jgi:aspartate/methionine/tyrosine aminotransferase